LIIHYNTFGFEFDAEFYDNKGTLTTKFIVINLISSHFEIVYFVFSTRTYMYQFLWCVLHLLSTGNLPAYSRISFELIFSQVQAQKFQLLLANMVRNFMRKCHAQGMSNKSTVNQPNTTVTNVRGANSIGLNVTNPDMNVVDFGNPDSGDSGSGDSRSGDPHFGGSRSGDPHFGGSRSGDPHFGGSRSGDPHFGGSRSGDPHFGGSESSGSRFGDPDVGDPDLAVTDENSPAILLTPVPGSAPPTNDYYQDFLL
jgi:hypothetical protein